MAGSPGLKDRNLVRPADVPPDDDDLAALIDQLHRDTPELQPVRRRILRLQRQLRALVDDGTWNVYLALEEVANERSSLLATKLAARMSELQKF